MNTGLKFNWVKKRESELKSIPSAAFHGRHIWTEFLWKYIRRSVLQQLQWLKILKLTGEITLEEVGNHMSKVNWPMNASLWLTHLHIGADRAGNSPWSGHRRSPLCWGRRRLPCKARTTCPRARPSDDPQPLGEVEEAMLVASSKLLVAIRSASSISAQHGDRWRRLGFGEGGRGMERRGQESGWWLRTTLPLSP
jgi:hypothetical protein